MTDDGTLNEPLLEGNGAKPVKSKVKFGEPEVIPSPKSVANSLDGPSSYDSSGGRSTKSPDIRQMESTRTRRLFAENEKVIQTAPVKSFFCSFESAGVLVLTNFQLVLMPSLGDNNEVDTSVLISVQDPGDGRTPVLNIASLTKTSPTRVTVWCKDSRTFVFDFSDAHQATIMHDQIASLAFPVSIEATFAFHFKLPDSDKDSGWLVFDIKEDYKRMGVPSDEWRLSDVNQHYEVCDSYPSVLAVPASVSDEALRASSRFRRRGRLPVLSWKHPRAPGLLLRSAQPLVGITGGRCQEDESLLAAFRAANGGSELTICDARRHAKAVWNKIAGMGYESVGNYENTRIEWLQVENMHAVRDSYLEFVAVCAPLSQRTLRNLRRLVSVVSTRWFAQLGKLVTSAVQCAREISEEGKCILIHCSDGWNRTTQLVSLIQLLLDPHYRTLRGFQCLIEKEWVAYGHRFRERCGHGSRQFDNDSNVAPVFLQWLDCVWQLMQQSASAFEFNEYFLQHVVDEMYGCQYGTFLFNSQSEQRATRAYERTESLWTDVNRNRELFVTKTFRPVQGLLLGTFDPAALQIWEAFHLRYSGDGASSHRKQPSYLSQCWSKVVQ